MLPLPEALCGIAPDVRVVVLTGNNARLREQLCARYGEGGRVRALPFTEEVPRFFAAADVVLTKPGGLTSTEAAVFGVPLIHTGPHPRMRDAQRRVSSPSAGCPCRPAGGRRSSARPAAC